MLRFAARLLSPFAFLAAACGPQDPPREPSPTSQPSAASASLATSGPLLITTNATASPAPTSTTVPNARIGDTTCETDADCAITATRECCDCCPSEPSVTSRAWLSWRDSTQCKQLRCEPCSNAPCAAVAPPSAFVATCVRKSCTLFRKR